MKVGRIEITCDENVIQLENWPTVVNEFSAEVEMSSENADNVTVLATALTAVVPICKDGVCQLGEWKPDAIQLEQYCN